jgi:membrane protein
MDFFRDGGPVLAGSIAYFFLMSFVPFGLLLASIFGHFLGGNQEFYNFFSARLMRFFPAATSQISEQLTALVVYRQIGIITFVVYAFFASQLYMALEEAVRTIFRQKERRSWLTSFAFSLFVITLIALLLVVSFAATWAVQMLQSFLQVFPALRIGRLTGFLAIFVIPVLLVIVLTAFLYKLLPAKKVLLSHAFRGALFTAVCLEVARHLFTLYIIEAAGQYGAIYGSLSTFVIFLLWIFYSSCIFLIGAEIVCNLTSAAGKKKWSAG